MSLEIIYQDREANMAKVILKEDVFTDSAKVKAVKSDSPHAAFLLGRKGQSIDAKDAERYGVSEDGEVKESKKDIAEKEAHAKAVAGEIAEKAKKDEFEQKENKKRLNKAIAAGANK